MKQLLLTLAALCASAAIATAGVVGSAHDFSATGGGVKTTATQICIFCHAPHNTYHESTGKLWNHTMSSASYTTYSGDNGTSLLMGSKLCLSCHDGTVAITDLHSPASQEIISGVTITNGDNQVDGTTKMLTGSSMIGTDLTDDHPVGVVYGSQSYHNQNYAAGTGYSAGTGYDATKPGYAGDPTHLNIGGVMAVKFFANAQGQPQVECSTCHEPHNRNNNDYLLRVTNDYSRLCRDCHYTR